MSIIIKLNAKVGTAPGTTTFTFDNMTPEPGLGRVWNPYQDLIALNGGLGAMINTNARIRWDLIAIVGGGSIVLAMIASLLANAAR